MHTENQFHETELTEIALKALEKQTRIRGRVLQAEPLTGGPHRPDLVLELRLNETCYKLTGEIKANVDRRPILAQVKNQLAHYDKPGIFITHYLTPTMTDHCRDIDLQFIDAAGNTYINQPGMYVFVKGQKKVPRNEIGAPKYRPGTTTALKITFALLCKRDLRNATYRTLAKDAAVALGAVGPTYEGLAQRGFIANPKDHKRLILLEPRKMIDDWVANYPFKLRRTLDVRRFRVEDRDWWHDAELPPNAKWGGEVAADRLTNYLKPATQTIYLHDDPKNKLLGRLVGQYRLMKDPDGPIEVLRAFWNFTPDNTPPTVVPPLLVYADLMGTLQPRNIEVANLIHEKFLANADY